MKKTNKLAFTLIELLVVITIIGILATGATAVYTSQIQKARDTTRINDIKALQSGVEQFYQDTSEYPTGDDFKKTGTTQDGTSVTGVQSYVPKIPKDPKHNQNCNKGNLSSNSICGYRYKVTDDENNIELGAYELSTAFENTGNITSKAMKDGGSTNDGGKQRYEIGLRIKTIDTSYSTASNNTTPPSNNDKDLVIAGEAKKK